MIYRQEITTKSYFVNRFGKLSTSFLFWQMQDIAWEHAAILGFGFDNLKEHQQFWVLSRMLVKIKRRPKLGEIFTLETQPVGIDGLLALRDVYFIDKNGECIIHAATSWLVIDARTRRIIKLDDLNNIPFAKTRRWEDKAGKVRSPKSNMKVAFTPALYNEIDINQHFNSGRYLERIIDSYDFNFHDKNELVEFEINFAKEGVPADRLGVKKQYMDINNHLCSVIRESDSAELIKARLVWQPRT